MAKRTSPAKTAKTKETEAPAKKTTKRAPRKSTAKAKPKPKATPAKQSVATVALPTSEEIAARAYDLYLRRGRASGDPVEDWLQAERELLAERE